MRIMRLTVGPLPPAVYWRRRTVVLGAGLLFLIVLLYSCGGPSDSGDKPRAGGSPKPSATPTRGEPTPSGSAASPGTGTASPGTPEPGGGQQQDVSGGAVVDVPAVPAPAPGSCTDAEMSLITLANPTRVKQGDIVGLKLKIKNISNRTCNRDVGPDPQELFIKIGAQKIWSSDTCGTGRGSEVRSFPPNQENEYGLEWNGRDSSKCGGGVAAGPLPSPGEYQVFARLGTKLSEPVKLTITS
jgi:hypothetical protein